MLKKLINGIIFLVIGLIILCVSLFVTKDLATSVIGGLFAGAGIIWIVLELMNKIK